MNYAQQLNTVEWKNLRNKILKRDNYECLKCNNKKLIEFPRRRDHPARAHKYYDGL